MKKIKQILAFLIVIFGVTACGSDVSYDEMSENQFVETDEITNYVKLVTNKDKTIIIELYPDKAPITVANFQKLVSEKFYDGLTFHRVIKDFMIQTGDPLGSGLGGSENTIKGEFKNNGVENNIKHDLGIVSMARKDDSNPYTTEDFNSASSQFFICVNNNEHLNYLDGNYAAFGKVIVGFNNVLKLSKVATDENDKPLVTQKIKTMSFVKVVEE